MAETVTAKTEETEEQKKETETTEEEPKGISEEEVLKRIEDARKQEKDKLYDTIVGLKDKVDNLTEAQQKEVEEKERIQKEAQEAADKERTSKLSAEEKLVEQLNKIEEQLVKEREAREKQEKEIRRLEDEAKEERDKRDLDEYKAKLLKDAGDEIIPELVTGNSKTDVENSIARAKARYQEIFTASADKAKGTAGRKLPDTTNPDPDAMDEEDLKGIINPNADPGKIDPKYVENRDEILKRVASAYQKSQSG